MYEYYQFDGFNCGFCDRSGDHCVDRAVGFGKDRIHYRPEVENDHLLDHRVDFDCGFSELYWVMGLEWFAY
jgi:hypothetical protein